MCIAAVYRAVLVNNQVSPTSHDELWGRRCFVQLIFHISGCVWIHCSMTKFGPRYIVGCHEFSAPHSAQFSVHVERENEEYYRRCLVMYVFCWLNLYPKSQRLVEEF